MILGGEIGNCNQRMSYTHDGHLRIAELACDLPHRALPPPPVLEEEIPLVSAPYGHLAAAADLCRYLELDRIGVYAVCDDRAIGKDAAHALRGCCEFLVAPVAVARLRMN